jgi:hypothetical protein
VITDAEVSPEQQLRSRQVRYLVMMSLRAVCLVVGGVLVMVRPPLLGLWLTVCVLGALLLPWFAVILANDRAPKPEHRRGHRRRQAEEAPAQPALRSAPAPRVIDADE